MILSLATFLFLFRQIISPALRAGASVFRRRTRPPHKKVKVKVSRIVNIGFPSQVLGCEVSQAIAKGRIGGLYVPRVQEFSMVIFTAPILLKEHDLVWVDTRSGKVEVVERKGIAIWRSGWLN
jgi:hypothetical protein